MSELLQDYSVLQLLFMAYAALAIAKIILCLSNVPVAAAVLQRKFGGMPYTVYFIISAVGVVVITAASVLLYLYREKFSFFVVYSDKKTMREVLRGLQ